MKIQLTALLVLLLLLPVGISQTTDSRVELVAYSYFDEIFKGEYAPVQVEGCTDGTIEHQSNGFVFREENETFGAAAESSGAGMSGCALVAVQLKPPAAYETFAVAFDASREITKAETPAASDTITVAASQELHVRSGNTILDSRSYYAADAPTMEMQRHAPVPPFLPVPDHDDSILGFWFDDRSRYSLPPPLDGGSGVSFEATVRDIVIEYAGVPVQGYLIDSKQLESGAVAISDVSITVPYTAPPSEYDFAQIYIQVNSELEFEALILPDGTRIEDVNTQTVAGQHHEAADQIHLTKQGEKAAIRVPQGILEQGGPGNYELQFRSTQDYEEVRELQPLAWGLALVPFGAAIVAVRHANRFAREAFGAYRSAANGLIAAVIVLLVYYAGVMFAAALDNRIDLLTVWPLRIQAGLLYGQIIIACFGFLALTWVAKKLQSITEPSGP